MSIVSYVLVPRPVAWTELARSVGHELDMVLERTSDTAYDVTVDDVPSLMVQLETRASNEALALEAWPEWIRPRLAERPHCLAVQVVGEHDGALGDLQRFCEHVARTLDGIVYVPEAGMLVDGSSEIEHDSPAPSDDEDDNEDEDEALEPSEINGLGVCVLEFRREVATDELAACAREVAPALTVARREGNGRAVLADRVLTLDLRRMPKRGVPYYVRCEIAGRIGGDSGADTTPAVDLARIVIGHLRARLDIVLIDFEPGAKSAIDY